MGRWRYCVDVRSVRRAGPEAWSDDREVVEYTKQDHCRTSLPVAIQLAKSLVRRSRPRHASVSIEKVDTKYVKDTQIVWTTTKEDARAGVPPLTARRRRR